ncbi:homoserine O-acetyltransferase [Senna tora]|uniref:Homoserine O-acetyltransferase n=1 Tax=Senna tora TaxID=362788 RepID=A0A834XDB9_9FABA|nr:homoserine O-acetyltransferase [Senna tora]
MAVTAATNIGAWSFSFAGRVSCRKKLLGITNYIYENPIRISATTSDKSFSIRALDPRGGSKETEENSRNSTDVFISKEDVGYLSKLLVGSVVGAAAIKYGSAVFPEITTPNIVLALIMILTPMIVAVFLLIKESSLNRGD